MQQPLSTLAMILVTVFIKLLMRVISQMCGLVKDGRVQESKDTKLLKESPELKAEANVDVSARCVDKQVAKEDDAVAHVPSPCVQSQECLGAGDSAQNQGKPFIDVSALKIQKWWVNVSQRRYRNKIKGIRRIGLRLASVFHEEALICEEEVCGFVPEDSVSSRSCEQLESIPSLGARLAKIFQDEEALLCDEEEAWLPNPIDSVERPAQTWEPSLGTRLAKIFSDEICSDEEDLVPETREVSSEYEQVSNKTPLGIRLAKIFQRESRACDTTFGSRRREASSDESTCAGSSSESEDESVSEWMTLEAWRPSLGGQDPLRPSPGLELELPDPWCSECW